MFIEKLQQEYNCGCGKGTSIYKYEGILNILNAIIEDSDELVPGSVFQFRSITGTKTIIAVDSENALVQLLSETGPFALERLAKEVIIPEFHMRFGDTSMVGTSSFKKIDSVPDGLEKISPDWNKLNLLKDHWMYKAERKKGFCYEIEFDHELSFGLPITVYLTKNSVWYDPDQVDPEMIEPMANDLLAHLYQTTEAVSMPKYFLENIEEGLVPREDIDKLTETEKEIIFKYEGTWPLENNKSASEALNEIFDQKESFREFVSMWD